VTSRARRFLERAVPFFESLDYLTSERKSNVYPADLREPARGKLEPHQQVGIEFLFVINCFQSRAAATRRHLLESEGRIYFDSAVPHGFRSRAAKQCAGSIVADL
jgi:hypothetical protein